MQTVAVVGLGYVGLPLAVEFGKVYPTIGYDRSQTRIAELGRAHDRTGELSADDIRASRRLQLTGDAARLGEADFIVVAVPTPVDDSRNPDFGPLISASETVGRHMKRDVIVVYESTVYPGATEEVCIPVLEKHSNMRWRTDFHIGYSPERINPGDKEHTLSRIVKVVSGDDAVTLEKVGALYSTIVKAGVFAASSIRVAEAAKVIENTQRDLNIALINELAILFGHMGLDTLDVLEAAGTKWNFLPFRPGLVGGHCIGVDPYYLTYKAEQLGYHPQVILAGRRINDGMGQYIADKIAEQLAGSGRGIKGACVNVLGLTFKENVPDLRNSKVADVIAALRDAGAVVNVHDPLADAADARHEYDIDLVGWEALPRADAVVLAVPHRQFLEMSTTVFVEKLAAGGCVIDIKSALDRSALEHAGVRLWRL
ncbi:MAG: nucleotide sugar dehydrogenase [Betaproteobacteria bacterium]|nr:nucleotide sugar dehydrogenase [Betaproteobacteria bacterium]